MTASRRQRAQERRKPIILVIDDNPGDVTLVTEAFALVDDQAVVVSVENVPQAFDYLRGVGAYSSLPRPDLIMVDLNMPVFSGHDFLRDLRAHEQWRKIPTIVFSSSRREADIKLAMQLGASRFVSKPIEWDGYVTFARSVADDLGRLAS